MTEIFEAIIKFHDLTMPTPQPYGVFHICFVIISALACFLLCRFFKDPSEKTVRKILLIYSLICIGLEVYKQISFTFNVENGVITADYQWYAFPFQFCSTPMFVALIAAIVPSKRIYHACLAFLSTFGVIAGVLVMVTADTVFINTIGINIQTMIHHGSQISVGLFLLIRAGSIRKTSWAFGGVAVFLTAIAIALILNCTMIYVIPEGETFNMFFISPHFETSLPVYSSIQPKVPYPVFLFLYIFPYITVALGIHAAIYPLPRLIRYSRDMRAVKKKTKTLKAER